MTATVDTPAPLDPVTWDVTQEAAGILRQQGREDLAEALLAGVTPAPILTPPPRWDLVIALLGTDIAVPPNLDNLERYEELLREEFKTDADGQTILAALRLSAMAGAVYVLHDDAVALRLARSAPAALLATPLAPEVFRTSIRDVLVMLNSHGSTRVVYSPEDD